MSNGEKVAGFTEDQISAAARVLADRSAEACNVDKDDNWKIYGGDFIEDARAAIRALASQPAAPVQPPKGSPAEAWKGLVDKAIDVLRRHIVPDGISDRAALDELYGIFDGPEYRAVADIEQDRCDARQQEAMAIDRSTANMMKIGKPAAPPVQQPGDVRDTNGTIDGGDASHNQVFVTMDERPSTELWTLGNRCYLATTRPSAALTDEQEAALRDAMAEQLSDLYHCGRVWSAWGVGTMSEDDFSIASEDDDIVENFVSAAKSILAASSGAVVMPEGGV